MNNRNDPTKRNASPNRQAPMARNARNRNADGTMARNARNRNADGTMARNAWNRNADGTRRVFRQGSNSWWLNQDMNAERDRYYRHSNRVNNSSFSMRKNQGGSGAPRRQTTANSNARANGNSGHHQSSNREDSSRTNSQPAPSTIRNQQQGAQQHDMQAVMGNQSSVSLSHEPTSRANQPPRNSNPVHPSPTHSDAAPQDLSQSGPSGPSYDDEMLRREYSSRASLRPAPSSHRSIIITQQFGAQQLTRRVSPPQPTPSYNDERRHAAPVSLSAPPPNQNVPGTALSNPVHQPNRSDQPLPTTAPEILAALGQFVNRGGEQHLLGLRDAIHRLEQERQAAENRLATSTSQHQRTVQQFQRDLEAARTRENEALDGAINARTEATTARNQLQSAVQKHQAEVQRLQNEMAEDHKMADDVLNSVNATKIAFDAKLQRSQNETRTARERAANRQKRLEGVQAQLEATRKELAQEIAKRPEAQVALQHHGSQANTTSQGHSGQLSSAGSKSSSSGPRSTIVFFGPAQGHVSAIDPNLEDSDPEEVPVQVKKAGQKKNFKKSRKRKASESSDDQEHCPVPSTYRRFKSDDDDRDDSGAGSSHAIRAM